MKTILKLSYIFTILFVLASCQDKQSRIYGSVYDWNGEGKVYLWDYYKGLIDSIDIAADGTFDYSFNLASASHLLLDLAYIEEGHAICEFYLQPGKTLKINAKDKIFEGDNVKESEYLQIRTFYNYKFFNEDGTPVPFKEFLAQVKAEQDRLLKRIEGTCKEFQELKLKEIEDIEYTWTTAYGRRLANEGKDAFEDEDYRNLLTSLDLNDKKVDDAYHDNLIINQLLKYYKDFHPEDNEDVRFLKYLQEKVSNQDIVNEQADDYMSTIMLMNDNSNLVETFALYKEVVKDSKDFAKNEEIYKELAKLLPGAEAPDFGIQDVDGNTVQMKDIITNGKVTYMDVWATWCGPCCAEIPYVEKLVEKYKDDSRIQFVSVSLDASLENWHKKLDKDQPTWPQYVMPDAFDSEFATKYNIRAIPRFMLFDGSGKIITVSADRPSSDNICTILESYMK